MYGGDVAYKDDTYPGQHQGIIDRQTLDAVRSQLAENAKERSFATNTKAPSLLTGLIYGETGDRLCPTHTNKNGRRYSYYISKRLMHVADSAKGGCRLPAKQLDSAVAQAVGDFLTDEPRLIDALHLTDIAPDRLPTILHRAAATADELNGVQSETRRQLLHRLLHRVTVHTGSLHIGINRTDLDSLVSGKDVDAAVGTEIPIDLTVPIALRRRGVEAKLVLRAGQDEAATRDESLIALVAQGHHWFNQLAKGKAGSIKEIAEREETDVSDVGHNMQLAFLAPDIVDAIFAGRQPVELTSNRLRRVGTLPLDWQHQRRLLGFRTDFPPDFNQRQPKERVPNSVHRDFRAKGHGND